MDISLMKEMREEIAAEVEANRLARRGRRDSVAAAFVREVRLDFIRLVGVFRGADTKRKGRL